MRPIVAPLILLGLFPWAGLAAATAAPRDAGGRPAVLGTPVPISIACSETLAYEKAAAADGATPQAALAAASSGLATNERCVDPVMHPINEAFLLSLRGMAKVALHLPDWKNDFDRAGALLAQCAARHDKAAANSGTVCKTQSDFNRQFLASYAPPVPPSAAPAGTLPAPLVAPVNPPGRPAASPPPQAIAMPSPAATASPATIGPVPPPPASR